MPKRSLGERDAPRTSEPPRKQHLYLIFDDWELGYSIRRLNLSNEGAKQRPLPPPFIRLEATRECPEFFAAIGTKILATHPRYGFGKEGCVLPIVDVRSRGVNFAPGDFYPQHPIYLPVRDELFALDIGTFKMLCVNGLCPPRLEFEYQGQISDWSWVNLQVPTFQRMDVTSYAVSGQTILFSTADATFSFNTQRHEWKKRFEWPLPFSGQANFVDGLDVFVGLPKDVANSGHLCFCRCIGDDKRVWLSKENISSKDPAENNLGTTLVYLGEMMFCLVEWVSNGDEMWDDECLSSGDEKWDEECLSSGDEKLDELVQTEQWEELNQMEGEACRISTCYRLTTFSLSPDMNGDPTASKTAVQCYKVPSKASYNVKPVAFWL